jgi:ketosteroid isomerase-like protein
MSALWKPSGCGGEPMSRENVELVLGLYPAADVDYVQLFRQDERLLAAWTEAVAPFVHADFECAQYLFGSERAYAGLDGLRDFMLDWMAPWATYRVQIEQVIDLEDRVLLLNDDLGCRHGSAQQVTGHNAALWTVRAGKVARLEAYAERAEALQAAKPAD